MSQQAERSASNALPAPRKLPRKHYSSASLCILCQRQPAAVRLLNSSQDQAVVTDEAGMRLNWAERDAGRTPTIPWALEMKAVSAEDPSRLVKTLTGGILGCGGWVLSRGASDTGRVNLLFEFERQACLDIYTVLIASGIELSQNGHSRFTELCQCTRMGPEERSCDIASVDLEIHTYALDAPNSPPPSR